MAQHLRALLGTIALGVAAGGPHVALSNATGLPVAVDQDALYIREGESRTLVVGADIHVGDTIRTGPTGNAQLVFTDETRMVVGASSTLHIDSALFRSDGKAENFAVSLTRGAFRFASGNSDSSAYSVRTPTATLGIRGTEFDLFVDEDRRTWLALMEGEVRLCSTGRWPSCVTVRDNCAIVSVDSERRLAAPRSAEERDAVVAQWFAFIVSQERLRADFHSNTDACEGPPPPMLVPIVAGPELFDIIPQGGGSGVQPMPLMMPEQPSPVWPTERWRWPEGGSPAATPEFVTQLPPVTTPLITEPPAHRPDPPAGEPGGSTVLPLPAGVWLLLSGLGILAAWAGLRARRKG